MRKFLIAAVAVTGLAFSGASLKADEHEGVHGVLIDSKCGFDKTEEKVAKHPATCALKCADTGLGVVSKDKFIKFDEKGQKIAKEYLEKITKEDKEKASTKVHVEGKVSKDGKSMEVTAIHADKKKDEKKES